MAAMVKGHLPRIFITLVLLCASLLLYVTTSFSNRRDPPLFPPTPDAVFTSLCDVSAIASFKLDNEHNDASPTKWIFFITPTYSRREQSAELTRLGQTLAHVSDLIWLVAEDSPSCSPLVTATLQRSGVPFVHLVSPMPRMYEKEKYKPRGVSSRNAALDWIINKRNEIGKSFDGVIYFGDDDNAYDLRLFEEIRSTNHVSMFPVGLIGDQGVSSPIVREGQVIGFTDPWFETRHFPVDMAGFAVTLNLVAANNARMPYKAGHEEDIFLRSLKLNRSDIEPKAKGCTDIYVWHTQTVKNKIAHVKMDAGSHSPSLSSSLVTLLKSLHFQGVVKESPSGKPLPLCFKLACR